MYVTPFVKNIPVSKDVLTKTNHLWENFWFLIQATFFDASFVSM